MTVDEPGLYWPLYCEENIWQLCRHSDFVDSVGKVAFISNATRSVAVWQQKSQTEANQPVIWDYHVILLTDDNGWQVWDLDSSASSCASLADYLNASFLPLLPGCDNFAPRFRLFDMHTFAKQFSSDRSHMLSAKGDWLAPPPPWPEPGLGGALPLPHILDGFADESLTLSELQLTLLHPNR